MIRWLPAGVHSGYYSISRVGDGGTLEGWVLDWLFAGGGGSSGLRLSFG